MASASSFTETLHVNKAVGRGNNSDELSPGPGHREAIHGSPLNAVALTENPELKANLNQAAL